MSGLILPATRERNRQRERDRRAALRAANPGRRPWKQTMEHVLSRVDRSGECWLWTGAKTTRGYGNVGWHRRVCRVHRLVYEYMIGPIPEGYELDHLCRVHACCNPEHLEAVTHRENVMRGEGIAVAHAKKTACPRGHAYDIVLTNGGRWCSVCRREWRRKR